MNRTVEEINNAVDAARKAVAGAAGIDEADARVRALAAEPGADRKAIALGMMIALIDANGVEDGDLTDARLHLLARRAIARVERGCRRPATDAAFDVIASLY